MLDIKKEFSQIEKYALENSIPIIEPDGLEVLLKIIKEQQPTTILEIGTAIGYSALKMNSVCNSNITTFEREIELCQEAKSNFQKFHKEEKITLINEDFLEADISNLEKYDMIYIDAAKAQYYKFFKKAEKKLAENGIIVFDNLKFHNLVFNEEAKKKASKNLRQLLKKLENFLIQIQKEPNYIFEFIDSGDGIGILRKENIE